jgi:di/tricarboxylate transporter
MVGSGPLILVNDLLRNEGHEAYNLFSVTPVGIVLLLSGIGYFLLFGSKVLPKKKVGETGKTEQEKLVEKLNLPHNIKLLTVTRESSLAGKTTEEAGLWKTYHVNLLGIGKGMMWFTPPGVKPNLRRGKPLPFWVLLRTLSSFQKTFSLRTSLRHAISLMTLTPMLAVLPR